MCEKTGALARYTRQQVTDQTGIRASFQCYNTQADADLLLEGLGVLLAEV